MSPTGIRHSDLAILRVAFCHKAPFHHEEAVLNGRGKTEMRMEKGLFIPPKSDIEHMKRGGIAAPAKIYNENEF